MECHPEVVGSGPATDAEEVESAVIVASAAGGLVFLCGLVLAVCWFCRGREHQSTGDSSREDAHHEWIQHREAQAEKRARLDRQVSSREDTGKSAVEIIEACVRAAAAKADAADNPRHSPRSQGASPAGSPRSSLPRSRSPSKGSRRTTSKGSVRGGGPADGTGGPADGNRGGNPRHNSNRAVFRQIYEERLAISETPVTPVAGPSPWMSDDGSAVEVPKLSKEGHARRSQWSRRLSLTTEKVDNRPPRARTTLSWALSPRSRS